MVSSLSQNDRDNRDFSSILEGLWCVTDELNELVQYLPIVTIAVVVNLEIWFSNKKSKKKEKGRHATVQETSYVFLHASHAFPRQW